MQTRPTLNSFPSPKSYWNFPHYNGDGSENVVTVKRTEHFFNFVAIISTRFKNVKWRRIPLEIPLELNSWVPNPGFQAERKNFRLVFRFSIKRRTRLGKFHKYLSRVGAAKKCTKRCAALKGSSELKFKEQYPSLEREIKFRRCLFAFYIKRNIGQFHVVVVQ